MSTVNSGKEREMASEGSPIVILNLQVEDDLPLCDEASGLITYWKDWNYEESGADNVRGPRLDVNEMALFGLRLFGDTVPGDTRIALIIKELPTSPGANFRAEMLHVLNGCIRGDVCCNRTNNCSQITIIINTNGFGADGKLDSLIGKTIEDFKDGNKSLNTADTRILVFVRNVTSLLKSEIPQKEKLTKKLIENSEIAFTIAFVGFEDGVAKFNNNREDEVVDFLDYYKILNPDETSVSNELWRNTNVNIGHFELPHSHARTHYSIHDFIPRDFVRVYLYKRLLDSIASHTNIAFLFAGHQAEDIKICFEGLLSIPLSAKIADFGENSLFLLDTILADSEKRSSLDTKEALLVVTDIVSSGVSLNDSIDKLRAYYSNKAIFPFSIIKMKEARTHFDGADCDLVYVASIQRNWYPTNSDDCPLCKSGQPLVKIDNNTQNFQTVLDEQPTPYDFWELVKECKALNPFNEFGKGKPRFRINTGEISKSYRRWLRGLIAEKLRNSGFSKKTKIDVIATVDESESVEFTEIVCEAVNTICDSQVGKASIDKNNKNLINNPWTIEREGKRSEELMSGKYVLFVDDGINSGNTMEQLSNYYSATDDEGNSLFQKIGAVILDSRIGIEELEKKGRQWGFEKGIVPLYVWEGKEVIYREP